MQCTSYDYFFGFLFILQKAIKVLIPPAHKCKKNERFPYDLMLSVCMVQVSCVHIFNRNNVHEFLLVFIIYISFDTNGLTSEPSL